MQALAASEIQTAEQQARRPYFEIVNPEIATIVRPLGRGLKVLDVGCGSGMHGAALKAALGHEVYGVDNSPVSIAKARTRIDGAELVDVRRPDLYPFPGASSGFDLLVFSDILEHLTDPLDVLRNHVQLLASGGHVVLSIPNIAIWDARLRLMLGVWEYQDTGTFDRTHLRFFTRRSMRKMIREAGLEVVAERISPGIVRPLVPLVKAAYAKKGPQTGGPDSSSILDSKPYQVYQRFAYPLESLACRLWPGLLAFQFIFLCKQKEAAK